MLVASLVPLSWLVLGSTPQEPAGEPPTAPRSRVVFHASPVVDLYFHVRVDGSAATREPLAAAARLARELDRALGGQALAWGPLDGLLIGCRTVDELRTAFARAPETITLRGGARVDLRQAALELAAALAPAEAAFAELWEERKARLEAARGRWESLVGAKEQALLDYHLRGLGMTDPGLALPVYLIVDPPWPGALTVFDDQRRGVSFVGASAGEGSLFLEIVLHELTHSLDLACGERSALGELRARLSGSGTGERRADPAHALMFVQSAESIRRVLDPAHRDYGEVEKVYERLGASTAELRGLWCDHLYGKLSRAEALDAFAASLAPAPR